jgi:hypothetical protein
MLNANPFRLIAGLNHSLIYVIMPESLVKLFVMQTQASTEVIVVDEQPDTFNGLQRRFCIEPPQLVLPYFAWSFNSRPWPTRCIWITAWDCNGTRMDGAYYLSLTMARFTVEECSYPASRKQLPSNNLTEFFCETRTKPNNF